MKLDYTRNVLGTLEQLPAPIRKAFYKQATFLVANLHHRSHRGYTDGFGLPGYTSTVATFVYEPKK
jgi:hypothetical protein